MKHILVTLKLDTDDVMASLYFAEHGVGIQKLISLAGPCYEILGSASLCLVMSRNFNLFFSD